MNGDDRAGLIKSEVPRSDVGEVVHATAVATASPPPQAVQGYAVQGTVAEPPLMLPRPSAAGGMVTGSGGGQRPPHVYTQQPGVPIIIYAQDPAASNPYRYPPPSSHASLAFPPPQYPGGAGAGAGPPYGYWRDGICDCCSNLWPSCCCTCIFHGAWLAAQISQKMGYISFRIVLVAYFCIFIGTWFISGATNNALWLALPGGAVWLLGIGLRLRFVRHFAINTHGTVLEVCNAACCCCCSLAQMSRHMMGYNKICDGDADPDPRDYYYAPAPGHGVVHPNV